MAFGHTGWPRVGDEQQLLTLRATVKSFPYTDQALSVLETVADRTLAPLLQLVPPEDDFRQTIQYEALWVGRESLSLEATQKTISDLIQSGQPSLVTRFGSTELRVLIKNRGRMKRSWKEKTYAAVARLEAPVWSRWEHRNLGSQSGFFPINRHAVNAYCHLMESVLSSVDILGSWVPGENVFADNLSAAQITQREHLEPFFSVKPWTHSLAGKRVLVVHPFANTIERQFGSARAKIWPVNELLPDFFLEVIPAVQSLGGARSGFASWFEALEFMKREMAERKFDVAIIGAGAYGMPLGTHAKALGKVAIHLGGVTQLLFGIRGRRWDEDPRFLRLFNDSWVRPLAKERPTNWKRVDQGVYW